MGLSIWSTHEAAPDVGSDRSRSMFSGKHVKADVRYGDTIRVLVNQDGWCDVVGHLESDSSGKWNRIVGWQTPFCGEPLYMGVGLRHTTVVSLVKTYPGTDETVKDTTT